MKRLYFTLLLGLLFQGLHGQTLKAYLKAAENAYSQKNYYSALTYFGYALEVDENQPLVWYKLAESAAALTAFHLADSAYQQVIERSDSLSNLDAKYKLAQVRKQLGQYRSAEELFYEFAAQIAGANDSLAQRAVAQAEECSWAQNIVDNTAPAFQVTNLDSMGVLVNSPYSEFGAQDVGEKLYFTSFRFIKEDDSYEPPRPYMKILKGENDQAALLFQEINDDSLHTAYLAFNTTNTKVYYSLCRYVAVSDIRCTLYSRDYFDNDSLGARDASRTPQYGRVYSLAAKRGNRWENRKRSALLRIQPPGRQRRYRHLVCRYSGQRSLRPSRKSQRSQHPGLGGHSFLPPADADPLLQHRRLEDPGWLRYIQNQQGGRRRLDRARTSGAPDQYQLQRSILLAERKGSKRVYLLQQEWFHILSGHPGVLLL